MTETKNDPRERFTQEEVIHALRESSGVVNGAAKLLDCGRRLVTEYINRYPSIKAACEEERERSVDIAENEQLKAMLKGERWAIENWLFNSREGRARGWLRHAEQIPDNVLMNAIQIFIPDNTRDDIVDVVEFDAPDNGRQAPYPITVKELEAKHHMRTLENKPPDNVFPDDDDAIWEEL